MNPTTPHPQVQEAIAQTGMEIRLVSEAGIRNALNDLFETQALVVEPSSAVPLACLQTDLSGLDEPICVILTGANIAADDHRRLLAESRQCAPQ